MEDGEESGQACVGEESVSGFWDFGGPCERVSGAGAEGWGAGGRGGVDYAFGRCFFFFDWVSFLGIVMMMMRCGIGG